MDTVFSHIIRKRFSQKNEDVATDALAYVLESSDAGRRGMTKFLRGIIPDLPQLLFRTQQREGTIRPDMWGFADGEARVFVENKFWAGLTDNQPISYLKQLAAFTQPTILLVIAPAAREHSIWRELKRRLLDAGYSISERAGAAGVVRAVDTQLGPILALTSWTNVLSVLEHEAVNDPSARADLVQLRALCDTADNDTLAPTREVLSDQRTPAFILQLGSIVQEVVELAVTENVLNITGLKPQAGWERIGRYVRVSGSNGVGAWLGIHFDLWKLHGSTPLWLVFSQEEEFGRAQDVRRLIEPWAVKKDMVAVPYDHDYEHDFAIALDIRVGEEKARMIRSLVDDLKAIAAVLCALMPKPGTR